MALPRLDIAQVIVDKDGKPSLPFHIWWQTLITQIETILTSIQDQVDVIQDALDAAAAAQAAADAANTAAAAADAAASGAQDTANAITEASALANSYPSGATISATDAGTDATITISAHNREYPQPDGTTDSVAVNGGSVTGLAYSTFYYIYYDDPTQAGGAVVYQATTSSTTAVQAGDRHVVGGALTPAALGAPLPGTVVKGRGSGDIVEA